jgi:hypothetical protein
MAGVVGCSEIATDKNGLKNPYEIKALRGAD